MTATWN